MDVLHQFRRYITKPHVRPWAMLAPILVLLICLPLLRPLRHPDPREISNDELARLATIQALVEHRTLAIDGSSFQPTLSVVRRNDKTYAAQPPTLAVLLAGPAWIMDRCGLTLRKNPALAAYFLTLLGAALPVAACAIIIYRMGRLFELSRKKRALLGGVVVFGGGLVSYATVINPAAPAATLLLLSAACIIYVAIARRPRVTSGWLAMAGMSAAFAAAILPTAAIFLLLFAAAVLVMRWHWSMRAGGLCLYALGAAGPLFLHGALNRPITGDFLPPEFHREVAANSTNINTTPTAAAPTAPPASASTPPSTSDDTDDVVKPAWWDALGVALARIANALLGEHGIFSHFPVAIFGAFGVAAVMHRHWPKTTKALATATTLGAVTIIIATSATLLNAPPGPSATAAPPAPPTMFGPQTSIVFLPLVLFWAGAWMRRKQPALKWSLAGVLLAFSVTVTLLGATDPCPRQGYDRYTPAEALSNLIHGNSSGMQPLSPPVLAGR